MAKEQLDYSMCHSFVQFSALGFRQRRHPIAAVSVQQRGRVSIPSYLSMVLRRGIPRLSLPTCTAIPPRIQIRGDVPSRTPNCLQFFIDAVDASQLSLRVHFVLLCDKLTPSISLSESQLCLSVVATGTCLDACAALFILMCSIFEGSLFSTQGAARSGWSCYSIGQDAWSPFKKITNL